MSRRSLTAALLATAGLLACGDDAPADGEVLAEASCDDEPGDTGITEGVTGPDGNPATPGELVPPALIDLLTVDVTLQAPGTIAIKYSLDGDVEAELADVDATTDAGSPAWRLVTSFDSGHRIVLVVSRGDDGDLAIDAHLSGRFEARRQVTDDEDAFVEVDADIRAGEGIPFPGVIGIPADLDRDGPLGIETTVDGSTVAVRMTAVDAYLDEDDFPFAEVASIVGASVEDNRIDTCDGPLSLQPP